MRRIVLGVAAIAAWTAGGCSMTSPVRPSAGLGTRPPAPTARESSATPGSHPIFSRAAVPDAVMLRDQADAGYTDRLAP